MIWCIKQLEKKYQAIINEIEEIKSQEDQC